MTAFASGFLLGLSLIFVIGPQNAFLLRQGLRGEHVFALCMICTISDAILILAGVGGLGALIEAAPMLGPLMRYGGAAFLVWYGLRSLHAAFMESEHLDPAAAGAPSLASAVGTVLALTWLNPHVYLDTVLVVGAVGSTFGGERWLFAAGATAASALFFFSLGYGAAALRPVFARPAAWRVLDISVAAIMLGVAAGLVLGA
ncbi:MAG: LysE/ArgO family amino acid transporter [Rubricella sp.]